MRHWVDAWRAGVRAADLGPLWALRRHFACSKAATGGLDSEASYDNANSTKVATMRAQISPMPTHQMRASRLAHLLHARANVAGPGPPATRISTDCIGPNSTPHRKQFQDEPIR